MPRSPPLRAPNSSMRTHQTPAASAFSSPLQLKNGELHPLTGGPLSSSASSRTILKLTSWVRGYESVNIGAKKSPVSSDWQDRIRIRHRASPSGNYLKFSLGRLHLAVNPNSRSRFAQAEVEVEISLAAFRFKGASCLFFFSQS